MGLFATHCSALTIFFEGDVRRSLPCCLPAARPFGYDDAEMLPGKSVLLRRVTGFPALPIPTYVTHDACHRYVSGNRAAAWA